MAENKQELLAEAYRRGILPEDKRLAYEQAMQRGLVPDIRDGQANANDVIGGLNKLGFGGRNEGGRTMAQRAREDKWRGRMEGTERDVAGALATGGGMVPFLHEAGGATNAVASAAYNLPGLAMNGDFETFGDKVAQAYDDQVRATKGSSRDFQARRPNTAAAVKGISLGGQGLTIAKNLPALLPWQQGSTVGNVARTGAAAAAEGGLWGGLYGFGSEEGGSFDERVARANEYGKFGAMIGGPLGIGLRHGPALAKTVREQQKNSASGQVLEMARQSGTEARGGSADALIGLLKRAGYARKDINRGLTDVRNLLNDGAGLVERPSIFAVELQKRFPAASQQIEDAFQQLATAPPKQGNTSQTLLGAIDDQYATQGGYLDDVFQDSLGVTTVADEQAVLAAERAAIGKRRDQVIKYAPTDARVRAETHEVTQTLIRDMQTDPRANTLLWDAARNLGFKGNKTEAVNAAMRDAPYELLQKFGEVARTSTDDVVKSYRNMTEQLFDDVARQGPRTEFGGFAKQVPEDQVGPYKTEQRRFAENYSQEDAIREARSRVKSTKDPVDAAETIDWYNTLPPGEQRLFQTVLRQDMEKMLRGGNIDDAGAYLTNLRKRGLHDLLVKVLGKNGEDISRAIQSIADEQPLLSQIDPRQGMQRRVVRGSAAQKARNLYTNNPIARFGDSVLTPGRAMMMDVATIAGSGGGFPVPWASLGHQATRMFRPGTKTREGLANILAMRPQNAFNPAPPTVTPAPSGPAPRPIAPPPEQRALPGPATAAPAAGSSPRPPGPTPRAEFAQRPISGYGETTIRPEMLIKPQEQNLAPAMKQRLVQKRMALLSPEEKTLPPQQQVQIIERRENWSNQPQSSRSWIDELHDDSNTATTRGRSKPLSPEELTEISTYPAPSRAREAATLAAVTSPLWGYAGLMAYLHYREKNGTDNESLRTAVDALERVSKKVAPAPSLKPDLSPNPDALISSDGKTYFDKDMGVWQPIENLERNPEYAQ